MALTYQLQRRDYARLLLSRRNAFFFCLPIIQASPGSCISEIAGKPFFCISLSTAKLMCPKHSCQSLLVFSSAVAINALSSQRLLRLTPFPTSFACRIYNLCFGSLGIDFKTTICDCSNRQQVPFDFRNIQHVCQLLLSTYRCYKRNVSQPFSWNFSIIPNNDIDGFLERLPRTIPNLFTRSDAPLSKIHDSSTRRV